MAWKIKPSFELPDGFELWEDAHFLELTYKGEQVDMFTHAATPKTILERCRAYQEERGK